MDTWCCLLVWECTDQLSQQYGHQIFIPLYRSRGSTKLSQYEAKNFRLDELSGAGVQLAYSWWSDLSGTCVMQRCVSESVARCQMTRAMVDSCLPLAPGGMTLRAFVAQASIRRSIDSFYDDLMIMPQLLNGPEKLRHTSGS